MEIDLNYGGSVGVGNASVVGDGSLDGLRCVELGGGFFVSLCFLFLCRDGFTSVFFWFMKGGEVRGNERF